MTQALDELPAKNSAEHFHRQEEVSTPSNPALVVG